MLLAVLASVTIAGLVDRPAELLGSDNQQNYSAWLRQEVIRREALWSSERPCRSAELVSERFEAAQPGPKTPPGTVGPEVYETVAFVGCGRTSRQNVVAIRMASGGWRAGSMWPGDSRADMQLQNDVYNMLRPQLIARLPRGCGELDMVWSPVVLSRAPASATDYWEEDLTVRLCSKSIALRITYTPNNRIGGTDFAVKQL